MQVLSQHISWRHWVKTERDVVENRRCPGRDSNRTPLDTIQERYFYASAFSENHIKIASVTPGTGERGSVVDSGTMLQTGRSRVRVPMRWIFFQLT
jgi:hypothetical protein